MVTTVGLQSPLALARTFLFVPADRPERYARALAAGPGGVIVDLEDAVAAENKVPARAALADAFAALAAEDKSRILVRVNAFATQWHEEDRALVGQLSLQGLGGVVFPKAENSADLVPMVKAVCHGGVLIPLIESAKGLDAINAIAGVPKVLRLAFGHLDFQVDLGLSCDPDELELASVRLALVMASRRADLATPIDGVTVDWKDVARLEKDALRARRGGFGAKLCIHPQQVPIVQDALGPTSEEVIWARRVIDAAEAAAGGVVSLDGRMVDTPVVLHARRVLGLSAQLERIL
ncbi:citrate lyase subunit beta / citryl-CoA lyase [Variovorax sp. HW608]|uniref:HpcH/HpaI aldolase/citrate lyase family protein n=1 Tax=Variovorax sp. HW608 TaxID=1034889 RepID=UPI00081F7DCB|nr:CoA ester lyase [Variovorax sp. HW608]SCK10430.1 citrate lyase subunit beta / citryl-CoA lyase [Variovorax sp. HW608]